MALADQLLDYCRANQGWLLDTTEALVLLESPTDNVAAVTRCGAELARRLEELVADAYDWLGRAEDEDAQEIYDTLVDLSERLGNPPEDTVRTEGVEMPSDRNSGGDV